MGCGVPKETLWDQLNKIFPEVLPADASQAINGVKLLELVRPRLNGKFADDSIRGYFSYMAHNQGAAIAKKSGGNGYYLRTEVPSSTEIGADKQPGKIPATTNTSEVEGRDETPEEKFRALFMRYSELTTLQFPTKIEHTQAKKGPAGQHIWKFPDVVILRWAAGKSKETGAKLDPTLLATMSSLGEPPFMLQSVELKVSLSLTSVRENFFQCLSNSKWAHRSTLVVAANVDDEILRNELERLGASYDVSILTYGIPEATLQTLPSAKKIRDMPLPQFEQDIAPLISESRISGARDKAALDWETIKDLQSISGDFVSLFEWIAYCLEEKQAFTFDEFSQIRRIKKKA
jgi:hypothetical protein